MKKIPCSYKVRKHAKFTFKIALALVGVFIAIVGLTATKALAASDASFSLSPASGSYTVGNTFSLAVSETSASGDDTDAVQVNLSYPSNLTYNSTTLSGPFTLCAQNSGGSGAVNLGCASTTSESGTQSVASISFTVNASGSATVFMTSGSNIDNTSGQSVWNGSLPSASYTLSAATSTSGGGSGGTTGGSGGGSTGTTSSSKRAVSTATSPSKATTTTKTAPTTTTSPTPAATTTTTAPTASLGSLSINVKDSNGLPADDAKVILGNKVAYTNKNGVANFSGVSNGKYQVTISIKGQKTLHTSVSLSSGQNKLVSYRLDSSTSSTGMILAIIVLIVLCLIIIAEIISLMRHHNTSGHQSPSEPNMVIGGPGASTPISSPPPLVSAMEITNEQSNEPDVNMYFSDHNF